MDLDADNQETENDLINSDGTTEELRNLRSQGKLGESLLAVTTKIDFDASHRDN